MAVEVEHEFEVEQSPGEVWRFLVDARRVVECLPGAQLTGRVDERTYEGRIGLELGPVGLAFSGRIRFDRLDEEELEVEMSGSGSEEGGDGNVRMRMHSRLRRLEGGGTRVAVRQEVELSGRLASFGHDRLVRSLADVMFGRFARCVTERLAEG